VDEEAYGRVTDPERYRTLHDAAGRLVDRLAAEYDVERVDEAEFGDSFARGVQVETVVRLSPRDPSAAPLAVAVTAFPGVLVRFGRWHVEAYPRCGCDACDEQPAELIEDLTDHVEMLVAGDFSESLAQSLLTHAFVGGGWGERRLSRQEADRLGERGAFHWQPWMPRVPRAPTKET